MSYSVYRGDGKRAWKQSASGSRTYFFYDGDTLIGTSGAAANSASVWLWGADGLIGTQTKNAAGAVTSGYYLYDAQGNLAQTVSDAGVVTPVAAYTAWGEVVPNADGSKPALGSLGYGAKFGYWRDSDSGLYLCTLRFYDPASGRFVTRDPIGFGGGSNLFGYTGNDPSNGTDPSGLFKFWDWRKAINNWLFGEPKKSCPDDEDPAWALAKEKVANDQHAIKRTAQITKQAYNAMYNEAPKQLMFGSAIKGLGMIAGATRFGNDANQVYHVWRHIDELGLDRGVVQNAVEQDLSKVSGSITGFYKGNVAVNGINLEYRAFKLPNGTINVGTIFASK